MRDEHRITDEEIDDSLWQYDFKEETGGGRLMLAELILKASAGYRNSHTEECFLKTFDLLKKDRTPNKKGRVFLCSMFYNHSNKKPIGFYLIKHHRFD